MKINASFDALGIVVPVAAPLLNLCFTQAIPSWHEDRNLRHPFGIYTTSVNTVARCFAKVIAAWESAHLQLSMKGQVSDDRIQTLLEGTDQLLDALMEHMEDCESIIECFFPKKSSQPKPIELKGYRKSVEAYRDHIGNIVNFIKHNQGRLRMVEMISELASTVGYFVEGALPGNVLGPTPQIHSGSTTAFSYARDLRYHVCAIFSVSESLAEVIEQLHPQLRGSEKPDVSAQFVPVQEMIGKLAGMPINVFPDEGIKPFPNVSIVKRKVEIAFPSVVHPEVMHGRCKIRATYQGDGVTNGFKILYPHAGGMYIGHEG